MAELQTDQPAAKTLNPNVPPTWPGATGLYQYSKRAVLNNPWTLAGLLLIPSLVSVIGSADRKDIDFNYVDIATTLISVLFTAALAIAVLASIRNQKIGFVEALSQAMPFWLKNIGLTIIVTLSYIVSFLLLIVPFFFVFPRLSLATYYLVDKRLGVIEAYKASWHATEGHARKAWSIALLQIAILLLFITLIGIPFSIYFSVMYSAAFGLLYEMLRSKPTG